MRAIKVPSQCYRRAKNLNLLNEVVFYYQLKQINDHGFFEKGSIIADIQEKTKLSSSSIWMKLRQLKKCGLINHNHQGYRLVSYDKLFDKLGYDLSIHIGKGYRRRKGSFKIHKITPTINDIKSLMAFIDIRENLNKQIQIAFYNLTQDKRYQYAEPSLYCSKSTKVEELDRMTRNVRMVEYNDQSEERALFEEVIQRRSKSDVKYCNPDVTLSLKGICKVLGLSNTSSAHVIVNKLVEYNLLTVKRGRSVRVGAFVGTYQEYLSRFASKYILRDGVLFRRMANMVRPV